MGEEMLQMRAEERESLRHIIQQWNSNRLDLFEISEPDENLEFHGVMRFYFQDSGQKVATKCIRVSSTANTRHVIETLIEKFRPDMRMLSIPEYTLYEIHENGDERRLSEDEKPLLVQLNWNKDDREGRFLLRRMDMNGVMKMKTLPPIMAAPQTTPTEETFIRKLSRREKKELKKAEKIRKANENNSGENSVAEKLYTELPETSFTRSISNPEAVMRRRRAQKLEKKLQQFRSKDGGPDTGGTLKIYGESLCRDVPYKTLLLSVRDSAASVVKEMLEKYGLYREDPSSYCLVQCIVTAEETVDGYQGKIIPQKEYILDDDECPLAILMNHPPSRGSIMFQVRRRPADHGQRRRKKKPLKGTGVATGSHHQLPQRHPHHTEDMLPYLVELGPDGNELGKGGQHQLHLNVTEVGSDRSAHTGGQSLQLFGPHIQPRHCVIAHTDGIVTVTPCSRGAETYVNFQRIYETTILQHGSIVRFGRSHTFRFVDPQQDDRFRFHLTPSQQPIHHHPQYHDRSGPDSLAKGEGGFSPLLGSQFGSRASSIGGSQTSIAKPPFRAGSEMTLVRSPHNQDHWNNYERYGPPRDPILPAVLEFKEDVEDPFLHNITTQLDPTDIQFKLAPTYTLYMAARFRASTHYRPDLSPTERAQKLTIMLTKVASIVHDVIEFKHRDPTALAFWMANASELLHFLKQDRHICGYSLDAQDILADSVQFAFRKLVDYMQTELSGAMPVFLEDRDDREEEEGTTAHVLSLLTNTMALLRRCRVNAALTIQLFSQLFHYINMWVFNKVVTENCPNYCSRMWGERIKERLGRIELWAEKQGLELAADCHLAKLSQAALLLIAPKSSPDDAANLSSTCFKLNSIQLKELLEKYQLDPGESPIPKEVIDNVVSVAETTADGLAREDGREVRLEEDGDLQLPFLLPEDGYSCDIVRGVPSGLAEFLDPLQRAQLCRMTPQPTSSGFWTIYMHSHQEAQGQRPPPGPRSPSAMSNRSMSVPRGEPEIHTIELQKFNNGMGLSIVATKGENQAQLGIYIKSVVPGGAADQDGRLQAGDQLLSVDGKSLVGISQEEAAQYMVGTGSVVTLEVARQGALYHGLAPLLSQPSPQVNRGPPEQRRELPPHNLPNHQPPSHHQPPPPSQYPPHAQPRIQSSKSVPSLNSDLSMSGNKSGVHEGFNPSYSRTSSSTSLSNAQQQPQQQQHHQTLHHMQHQQKHHHQQYPVRSRSTQNLNEGNTLTLTGRHPSSPALNTEDDRHYQNVSFHQGTQDPRMGSQRGGRPPIFPPQSSGSQSEQPRPTSAFLNREDVSMGRTEPIHRPTSQQNLRQDPRFGLMGEDPRKRLNGPSILPPQSGPIADSGFPMSPGSGPPSAGGQRPQYPRGHPKYNYNFSGPPPQMSPHSGVHHTQMSPQGGPLPLLPQVSPHGGPTPQMTLPGHPGQMSPQGYYGQPASAQIPSGFSHIIPNQPMSPQYPTGTATASVANGKLPPPTAPKPNRNSGSYGQEPAPEKPIRQNSMEGQQGKPNGPPRPPPPEEGYRDSPPPPPPPTSTHPLMQSSSRVNLPSSAGKQVGMKGPWDKDEKEKFEMRKREAARRWRDEQITALENLGAKTPQEEERMNTLKLEREFQRRAEERLNDDEDDDDEEEEEEEEEGDELGEVELLHREESQKPTVDSRPTNGTAGEGPNEEDRSKRADEIRRKQRELEAAKEAEERLLREAQRRQEEELRRHHIHHHHQQQQLQLQQQQQQHPQPHHHFHHQQQRHQSQASQRLDSLVGSPLNNNNHNNNNNNNSNLNSPNGPQSSQRIQPPNVSPLPPERGSSYSVMHQHQTMDGGRQTEKLLHNRNRPVESAPPPVKRVQFSEISQVENHVMFDSNANHEKREDPNDFINEAETLMNSTSPNRGTGATPGVIGAQEVYRDPRQRRLMEQAQKAAASRGPGPEKLTFREKMKMFAMEAEEGDSTPKDRIKHSKAQREIEHGAS